MPAQQHWQNFRPPSPRERIRRGFYLELGEEIEVSFISLCM